MTAKTLKARVGKVTMLAMAVALGAVVPLAAGAAAANIPV